jgi:hypothetical protein
VANLELCHCSMDLESSSNNLCHYVMLVEDLSGQFGFHQQMAI